LSRTILLIEPSPTLRTVVRLHLGHGRPRHDFLEAASAEEGLALLSERRVDLVIAGLDRQAEALQLLAALRDDGARGATPLVLVANPPASELQRAAARAGGVVVVKKPVTGPRLRAAIARLLG
jgi:CheY-like chemotaxis protein